jgi:5-(carboxyamino)imidazole ribonucleotide synthase
VARSPSGQGAAYPVVETVQIDGICREVIAPAPIEPAHAVAATQAAMRIAEEIGVVGLLAVEMFDTPAGVLVNELAMRPHNSGHWSIDGAVTSQFEQHLRAVLDLPLGDPRMVALMARDPGLRVHLYGKEVKPGRKVGHVTVAGDDPAELLERARHAAGYLRGDITE